MHKRPEYFLALRNQYPSLDRVYGDALAKRLAEADTRSFMLACLRDGPTGVLDRWDEVCKRYLQIVGDEASALEKVSSELKGCWKNLGFDGRLKDSFLELQIVCDLYHAGIISDVVPQPTLANKPAPDFTCNVLTNGSPVAACLEVKNVRAPRGILQAFQDALRVAKLTNDSLSKVNLSLTYHCDNTTSAEQELVIKNFLEQLVVFPLWSQHTLSLPNGVEPTVEVRVELVPGHGETNLVRPEGGSYPMGPQINDEALFKQVKSKLDTALRQFQSCGSKTRLLAANIDWPLVMFWSGHDQAIRAIVRQAGNVECFVFHNYQYFDQNLKTPPSWTSRYK